MLAELEYPEAMMPELVGDLMRTYGAEGCVEFEAFKELWAAVGPDSWVHETDEGGVAAEVAEGAWEGEEVGLGRIVAFVLLLVHFIPDPLRDSVPLL